MSNTYDSNAVPRCAHVDRTLHGTALFVVVLVFVAFVMDTIGTEAAIWLMLGTFILWAIGVFLARLSYIRCRVAECHRAQVARGGHTQDVPSFPSVMTVRTVTPHAPDALSSCMLRALA